MKALILIVLLLLPAAHMAQVRPKPKERKVNSLIERGPVEIDSQTVEIRELFLRVERGIIEGSAGDLSKDFPNQIALQISGVESGSYSSAQATALIQSYFSVRKPIAFSFSRTSETPPIIFATGRLYYTYKGSRESVQVYVSLMRQENRWVVAQFNMY